MKLGILFRVMPQSKSTLAGSQQAVYSIESADSRTVEIMKNQLIVENEGSGGRSLQLDKIAMVKKRTPRSTSREYSFLLSILLGACSVISVCFALGALSRSGITSATSIILTAVTGLLIAGSVGFYYRMRTKDQGPSEDEYFINIRAADIGVGFNLKSEDIGPFMDKLNSQMETSVEVRDNS